MIHIDSSSDRNVLTHLSFLFRRECWPFVADCWLPASLESTPADIMLPFSNPAVAHRRQDYIMLRCSAGECHLTTNANQIHTIRWNDCLTMYKNSFVSVSFRLETWYFQVLKATMQWKHTCSCGGAGGEHRQEALPLQVEEVLLLHLKELLLDGNLLGCQLRAKDNRRLVGERLLHSVYSRMCQQFNLDGI